jgi:ATP-dependent DNA ligase
MNEQTFTFPSSSGGGTYTARIASDGKLLCNCKGWTMRRGTSARHCKHTKEIVKDRQVCERGEFVYLADTKAAIALVPTLSESAAPANHRPMLASPMPERLTGAAFDHRFSSGWALEEKLDGHRVIVNIAGNGREVHAFSRPAPNKPPLRRALPPAMLAALAALGDCEPDGELVAPSGKAWDVVVKGAHLVFVAFDLLTADGISVMALPYEARRALLLARLARLPAGQQSVSTVLSNNPTWTNVEAIWASGGEGAILKRIASPYQPGYRSQDWLKVKPEHSAVLTIIGFEAGKSGPYSAIRLRDAGGIETTVKTLGNQLLRDISAAPHTFLGREVTITFQERTPAGLYRHGRFDHFTKE